MMTREEFKRRWDAGELISDEEITECAKDWELYVFPTLWTFQHVCYTVLKSAHIEGAEDFNPKPFMTHRNHILGLLRDLAKKSKKRGADRESIHSQADDLLCELIGDQRVTEAFDDIEKWSA